MDAILIEKIEKSTVKGRPEDCWPWVGTPNGNGYGRFTFLGQKYYVHRLIYENHNGKIPEGLHVLHSCDNRSCVNPAHLRAGTNKDNHHEAWQRDRFKSRRKLSPQDILDIRSSGLKRRVLAEKYGINITHVYQIRSKAQGDGILKMLT